MGYRRAWQLMDGLNSCFVEPVVIASKGGRRGRGRGRGLKAGWRISDLGHLGPAGNRANSVIVEVCVGMHNVSIIALPS